MIHKNVLIIEEDPSFLKDILSQFKEIGVTKSVGVTDGFSGVQEILKFTKHNKHFDLILASLRLPKINGYKLISELRKRFPNENIPFVMLMTEEDRDKLDKVLEAGIDDHVFKPFDLNALKNCLKKVWKVSDKDFETKKAVIPAGNLLVSMGQSNTNLGNVLADIGKKKPEAPKPPPPSTFSFEAKPADNGKPKPTIPAPPPPPPAETKKEVAPVKQVSTVAIGSGATGSSYLAKATTLVPEDMEPGPVDKNVPIDNIYFKLIQLVHGVDKNYFWAKEVSGKDTVELFLLTRTCKKSGIVLETVSKRDFCRTYFSSERYGCDLEGYNG